jgi:thiol-disulfide isomerase/thioredoxin
MEEDLKIEGSKLIKLKDTQEAKKLLRSKGPLMMVVYAKWCGHCQAMFEKWRELSNKAKVVVIEASDYTDKDISGYPDMRIVKKGKAKKYEGGRSVGEMQNALLEKSLSGGRRRRTRRFHNRVRKTARRPFRRNIPLM